MKSSLLNFTLSQPQWLWLLAVIPCIWLCWRLFAIRHNHKTRILQNFIDPKLLPHLLISSEHNKNLLKVLLLFSGLIALLSLALANPRWDFVDIDAYKPSSSMVILLDLSDSMNTPDIAPSRITRAICKN